MSKLEPTRTYSNLTATEELRRLLTEAGVEYFKHEDGEPLRKLEKADEPATSWHMGGASVCAVPIEGSDLFDLWIDHCTPEQAIAATLGRSNAGRYVGLRQGEYWERTENSDYYCGGCGWKVTDHDSYCPECGGALHKATLGRGMLTADDVRDLIERHSDASGGNGRDFHNGAYVAIADELNATLGSFNCTNDCANSERTGTCHNVWDVELTGRLRFQCSECGGVSLEITPRFCPCCGRKFVDPTTNDVDAEVNDG